MCPVGLCINLASGGAPHLLILAVMIYTFILSAVRSKLSAVSPLENIIHPSGRVVSSIQ